MAGKIIKTFAFGQHVIEVSGRRMENFAKGDDVIGIAVREDTFSDETGADGNMMVYLNADESAEITLKFLHGAPENDYLKRLFDAHKAGRIEGVYVSVWNTRDGHGEVSRSGYIKKIPDNMRGNKAGNREWVIVTARIDEQQSTV